MSEQAETCTNVSNMQGSDKKNIFPGYDSLSEFTKDGYKILMEGIKQSNCLPTGRDWNFYYTFDSVKSALNVEANQIIDNINLILSKNEIGGTMRNMTLDCKTERLIDVNDTLLERVANNIDEMSGLRKISTEPIKLQTVSAELPVNVNGSWNRTVPKFSVSSSLSFAKGPLNNKDNVIRLLTAENIVRPQKFFKDKIDNSNNNPWEPRIKEKPNSLKPLSIFLEKVEGGQGYSHPYLFELERFSPPDIQLTTVPISNLKLITETPLIEINKQEQLYDLVEDLRKYDVIAVDLEHHSYRSFMGITCLMQISTFDRDYLIDTLALRSEIWILNEIFTKPSIVKIFHGAHSDIQWLQRDLSLYVVNMFDTYFAAKQLGYSTLSLAYLMQRFCNFIPNKQFQLADWRIRPLPDELRNYAREDTHYLIFIYQKMRNELISKANGSDNLIKAVIQKSTDICKTRYSKPKWHEESHLEFYRRCNRMFDNRQMFALKELYKWRDSISREEDESTGYVLPNNMLLEIAQRLPREIQGIIACCNPVPPLVRANLLDLHKIVLRALDKPFEEPILKEDTRARGTTKKISKINVDSPLHCPHDLTNVEEFRDDLPTLLGNNKSNLESNKTQSIENFRSMCSVFNSQGSDENNLKNVSEKLKSFRESFKFLSPFDQYLLVKPFIQAREKKLAEERAKKAVENTVKPSETGEIIDLDNDQRTDDERIESIHQHFLNLSRPKVPEPPAELKKKLSLREMGGTKKRKRDEFNAKSSDRFVAPLPRTSFETPIPNIEITIQSNGRTDNDVICSETSSKRKSSDQAHNESPNKQSKPDKNVNTVKKKQQLKQNNNKFHMVERQPYPTKQTQEQASSSGGQNKNKVTHRNPRNFEPNGSADNFNAYDYSMVDFRQFSGGAGKVQHIEPLSSKYRGRGKQNKNSRGNKSSIVGRKRGF